MDNHLALAESTSSNHVALGAPPVRLYEAYRRLVSTKDPYHGAEQRSEPRHSAALRAVVIPLNARGESCGPPFVCLTNNISASGLSLLHTEEISEPLLEVELDDPSGARLRGILQVLRCRSLDDCFEIAGRFARRT